MHEDTILTNILIVVSLIFIASLAAIAVKKVRFPYTIGLLIVGILIGYLSSRIELLALGLPADFEHRVLVIDLTLGVVLMSLLIQGTTVSWLLKKVKVVDAY